jgi:hypothetical protein
MASRTITIDYVVGVYEGSDGEATKGLYAKLEQLGGAGVLAMNLFRAQKNSERAKVYRGRGYKDNAYGRKQWAMGNLVDALEQADPPVVWGWGEDPKQSYHRWVLYIDTPMGQVSFHTAVRGRGPDYPKAWDGVPNAGPGRICRWVVELLHAAAVTAA